MKTIKLTVEIIFTPIEGQQMPTTERLCDKASEGIYDLIIDDKALVKSVVVTHIYGDLTE